MERSLMYSDTLQATLHNAAACAKRLLDPNPRQKFSGIHYLVDSNISYHMSNGSQEW